MLLQITVKNFALVDEVHIDFEKGLNVLTGETGAGKSILIDALRAVLGERLSSGSFRDKNNSCVIEAVFSPPSFFEKREELKEFVAEGDDYLSLKREIMPDGKSRNYVNRRLVNLSVLKEIGRYLVDFHGQHDQQTIFETRTHLELVDRLCGLSDGGSRAELLRDYQVLFKRYKELESRKHSLHEASTDKQRQLDLLKYQIDEIENVSPAEGERELLESERIRLSHSRKLSDITSEILKLLDEEDAASSKISTSTRWFQQ